MTVLATHMHLNSRVTSWQNQSDPTNHRTVPSQKWALFGFEFIVFSGTFSFIQYISIRKEITLWKPNKRCNAFQGTKCTKKKGRREREREEKKKKKGKGKGKHAYTRCELRKLDSPSLPVYGRSESDLSLQLGFIICFSF